MKKTFLLLLSIYHTVVIYAQETYIPDDNFEQALIDLGYDQGVLNDYIPTAKINRLTLLQIENKNITDLTGIADFTSLIELNVGRNKLTNIDLSNNIALKKLYLDNNLLTTIDLKNNIALIKLDIGSNKLTHLDVSKSINLSNLLAYNNRLTSLDLSANTHLSHLNLSSNQLADLNLNKNVKLTHLDLIINQLTSLDISKNLALESLFLSTNRLTSLDLSKHTVLEIFSANNNKLTNLNIKNGTNQNIWGGDWIGFDVTNNPSLTCIEVDDVIWSTTNWKHKDTTATYSENCNILSTIDFANKNDIIIYPNPSTNYIKIQNNSNEYITTRIYDTWGKEVKTAKINFHLNTINIQNLEEGIYFIQLNNKLVQSFLKSK